jgi:hydrogenase-4 component E
VKPLQSFYDSLVILLVLLNFRLLSASQLGTCVHTVALQAFVIGVLAILTQGFSWTWTPFLIILVTLVKSIALPGLVRKALRETGVVQEIEPFVGYTLSILTGIGMLVVSFLATRPFRVPLAGGTAQLIVPVTLFTMLTGLFLIVSRKKAITQVLGFLTMENSIYLFGVAFAIQESWLVQTGVLLDVFAAVFIMGIMIYHINREFDDIDTGGLSNLRD